MKNNSQKEAFLNFEANEWFNRNKEMLKNYDGSNDLVVDLLEKYNVNFKNVLEIGCSLGHRLNHLKEKHNQCSAFGIDPSSLAIEFGKKKYPNINLCEGTADNMNNYKSNFFDVVIVGFVFYVIDRDDLLKVVSEIDRVLKSGGILIIVDFFAIKPHKNPYQHIKDFDAYSFKQSYEEVFIASKLYSLFDKITVNHQDHSLDSVGNYSGKMTYTLLKRDIGVNYE